MSILRTFEFTDTHCRLISLEGNIFDVSKIYSEYTFFIVELLYLSVVILGYEVIQK